MYEIPRYKIQLVREGSELSKTRYANSPWKAAGVIRSYINDADREHFIELLLDVKKQIIGIHTVSIGSLVYSIVHPREVFKPAILMNAAGILVAHNHPSGDLEPSRDDENITKRLVEAGEIIGIPVVDHIIIGTHGYFSFKEAGRIPGEGGLLHGNSFSKG